MQAIISFNFSDMKEILKFKNQEITDNVCSSFMNLLSINTNYIENKIIKKINFSNLNSIKEAYNKIYKIEPLLLLDEFDFINQFDKYTNSSKILLNIEHSILQLEKLISTISVQNDYNEYNQHIIELNNTLKYFKRKKATYLQINSNTQKYIYNIFKLIVARLKLYQNIIDICYLDTEEHYFDGFSKLSPLKKFVFYNFFILKNKKFFKNLPTSNIDFTFDCSVEDFEKKIINNCKQNNKNILNQLFEENISPMYEYNCQTLEQFLQVSLFSCLTFNINVKKCKNCGKYFIAYQRSDEKYCSRISPQDNQKTCKQYANFANWKNNINSNEELKIYRRIYMAKQMRTRRNPDDKKLKDNFEVWKKEAQDIRNKYVHGKIDKNTFITWLNNNS